MGFKDKFKKILGGSVKNTSFEYLDKLIKGDSRIITLNEDIFLDDGEELKYPNGIEVGRNYLIIDGNGHTIDAKNKTGIFSIKGLQIKLLNITFINAGKVGAINNDCAAKDEVSGLRMENCTFKNNHCENSGGAIQNHAPLTIINGNFKDNFCKGNGGAIANYSILNINNTTFSNNGPDSIYNENELTLVDSTFGKTKNEEIVCSDDKNLSLSKCIFANELFVQEDIGDITKPNFKFLDNLIHSGKKEVCLDFDISLDDDEKFIFSKGIMLDVDDITIDGNQHSIDANYKTCIFNVTGKNIKIKNLIFKNAYCEGEGSVINGRPDSEVSIINSQFYDNTSDEGGVISNWGIMSIENSKFEKNQSFKKGGAIHNAPNAILEIFNSNFKNNKSEECGAIFNSGELTIEKSAFEGNSADAVGAVGNNPVPYNQSVLNVSGSTFIQNDSKKDGGAILNMGIMSLVNSNFIENYSQFYGGGVCAYRFSISKISKTNFRANSADNGAAIFNDSEEMKCNLCEFTDNIANIEIIHTKGKLELTNSNFKGNRSKGFVIYNDEGSELNIFGGEITDNTTRLTAIFNFGKYCTIDKTKFENNINNYAPNFDLTIHNTVYHKYFKDIQYCQDMINDTNLTLIDVNIKGNSKTILNKGHTVLKKLSDEFLESKIYNRGTYNSGGFSEFNFLKLSELIHKDNNLKISLNENYTVDEGELEFFEGGIELDIDGIEIDGNGRFLSGGSKTRIFNITGKNITLKNIVFKNGHNFNSFDEHTSGGGAILIAKDASAQLINCHFYDNNSEDDGGAILNKGELTLSDSDFKDNISNFNGGSICNHGHLNLENDEFSDNESKVGSALYNDGDLFISQSISFNGNKSCMVQPIYNANFISINTDDYDVGQIIFNTGCINKKESEIESFTYLKDNISGFEECSLKTDIVFDYIADSNLKNGINITQNLVIEGNGHSIDGNSSSSLFNISGRVIFRNIIFKNCYSRKESIIENNGDVRFENCKFIHNNSMGDCNLIGNLGSLKIINSRFSDNFSKNNSMIDNRGHLEISKVDFINNNSYSTGGNINNQNILVIHDSKFICNITKREGVIANNTFLDIDNCEFKFNQADDIAGSLINWGDVNIYNSQFMENSSKNNAGAIVNGGNIVIKHVNFNNNYSGDSGGAILNSGELNIMDSNFKDNLSKNLANSVFNIGGNLNISNTIFSNTESKELFSTELAKTNLEKCKFKILDLHDKLLF